MRTWLYVDGFNLYYGALKSTPWRWLDPVALAQQAFPSNRIEAAKYFTAAVPPSPSDPGQSLRQQVYWRALRSLGHTQVIEGHFRVRRVWAPVAMPPPDMVQVIRHEEKGSDINLASHLLVDGFSRKFEAAILLSGDSDFVTPVRMLRDLMGVPVGVMNPQRLSGPGARSARSSAGLRQAASFYQNGVTWAQLQRAQLATMLSDAAGEIRCPRERGPDPLWPSDS